MKEHLPLGIKLLAVFFAFGATMCALTIVLLIFPGSFLEPLWRANPEAHAAFQSIGGWAIVLMAVVGTACALAAVGLVQGAAWGRRLALGILAVNLAGDSVSALVRHDLRTLLGLPIAGVMIWYLWRNGRS